MYIELCGEGSEGTTYAILTALSNVAYAVAYSIGTALTKVWDVTNPTLKAGQFSGLWRLSVLTSLLQPLPLLLIAFLPGSKDEQKKMKEKNRTSWWGGVTMCALVTVSLFFTVAESVSVGCFLLLLDVAHDCTTSILSLTSKYYYYFSDCRNLFLTTNECVVILVCDVSKLISKM
jgi:hypothetical protein